MDAALESAFRESICINVRSYRRDGTPVDTPTWVAPIDGKLYCYTDDRTFKVKRMRRNSRVELAASDVWGIRSMPWHAARVRFVTEPELRERVFAALREKYGIHWKLSLWGSLLVGRVKHRLVLEFELLETAAAGYSASQSPTPST